GVHEAAGEGMDEGLGRGRAALAWLGGARGLGFACLAPLVAVRFLDGVALLHDGAAAAFCDFGEVDRGPVRVGFERGERSIAGLGGGMTLVFPLSPDSSRSLARSRSTGELRF